MQQEAGDSWHEKAYSNEQFSVFLKTFFDWRWKVGGAAQQGGCKKGKLKLQFVVEQPVVMRLGDCVASACDEWRQWRLEKTEDAGGDGHVTKKEWYILDI